MIPFSWSVVTFFLVGSLIVSLVRIILGPTTADRLVGLNLVAAQVLALIVVAAGERQNWVYLDVAMVYDIFGFIGLLAIIRFFGKRMERK